MTRTSRASSFRCSLSPAASATSLVVGTLPHLTSLPLCPDPCLPLAHQAPSQVRSSNRTFSAAAPAATACTTTAVYSSSVGSCKWPARSAVSRIVTKRPEARVVPSTWGRGSAGHLRRAVGSACILLSCDRCRVSYLSHQKAVSTWIALETCGAASGIK